MDQMVCNDIACNCIPIVRIAFLECTHFILIAFLRILIAYLRKYAAYLGCCLCINMYGIIHQNEKGKDTD